jgi:hypothetical protein
MTDWIIAFSEALTDPAAAGWSSMLTLENSSPDSSVACAYYAKFLLTWGWLDQNPKTTGTPTINWPFRPVYGCSDIMFHAAAGASMYADM